MPFSSRGPGRILFYLLLCFLAGGCAIGNEHRRYLFNAANDCVKIDNKVVASACLLPASPLAYGMLVWDDTAGAAITSLPSALLWTSWIWTDFGKYGGWEVIHTPFRLTLWGICFPPVFLVTTTSWMDLKRDQWPETARRERETLKQAAEKKGEEKTDAPK